MPFASIRGFELYYERTGRGPPALMLPGLGTDMSYYAALRPKLEPHLETIFVDPRGLGRSRDERCAFLCEEWADDFDALLDFLKLDRVHVVGSSHGASMAMAMADRHQSRLETMTLIGAFSEVRKALEMNFRLRISIVEACGMGDIIANHIALWIFRPSFIESDLGGRAIEGILRSVASNPKDQYIRLCRSILHWGRLLEGQENEPKVTSRLKDIKLPSLVITGDSDHMIPASYSRVVADALPNASYLELSDCGHIPGVEQPDRLADAVIRFISSSR